MLYVRTLGELRLQTSEGDAVAIRRKPLALLCYVARHGARPTSRTELATLFWGERGEDRARQSLRQTLLELKQAIGDRAEVDAESVRIVPGAVDLDIASFERAIATANYRAAVDHWNGDFFDGAEDVGGDGFRRWVENERTALHRMLSSAMQRLLGDAELRGDWKEAVSIAERWTAALRFDETAHLRLIEALKMSGRAGDAASVHAAYATRLRTTLDVEPSAEFLQLGGGLADDMRTEIARRGKGSAALHTPPLLGRGVELQALMTAWASVSSGTPVVVLVRGESGTGLTRLGEELIANLDSKAVVLRGRGTDSTTAYAAASTLFEGIRDAKGTAGASPEALAEVARLVPSIQLEFKHLPQPRGDDASLRDGLAQTLAAIGEKRSVLVFLDDAHLADDQTRRLIGAIASRLSGRVMLLVTVDDAAGGPAAALGGLTETRDLRQLWLRPLDEADIEAIVGSMVSLGDEDRRRLATLLYADAGGLPHQVCALITALVNDHLLTVDQDGRWRLSPALAGRPLPVPAPLRDRAKSKFAHLTPEAASVAGTIAVLGAPSTASLIEDVSELSPDAVEGALAELIQSRFVVETGGQPGHYDFTSPLVARTLSTLLPTTKRRALHARAAAVLVKRDMAATAERSLLPYHLARAESQPVAEPAAPPRKPGWPKQRILAAGVAAAILLAVVAQNLTSTRGAVPGALDGVPVVALGSITNYRRAGSPDLTKPLIDMLATNLGRVPGMRVVSTARMYELTLQGAANGTDSPATVLTAARRAGATELVDGALYETDGGMMRLDLRRMELATGSVRKSHSVNGATLFELADSGTARLASDFGGVTPTNSVADVTTRSLAAYRLYEEGLRAFYENERVSAQQLFDAALGEDSTFAMAAYYAALTRRDNFREIAPHFERALRLVNRASDRERLTIQAQWALLTSSPMLNTLADSMTRRYPQDVEGHLFSGIGLFKEARYPEAVRALERAIAMDSVSVAGGNPRCFACDGFEYLVRAYRYSDDYPGAERVVRRWIRLQPRSAQAWEQLHGVLGSVGRMDEALEALHRRAALSSPTAAEREPVTAAQLRLIGGDFATAEQLLKAYMQRSVDPARIADATWYVIMLHRYQGQMREALDAARRYRALTKTVRDTIPEMWIAEAQVLYESGQYRQAAALYDTVARWESKARLTANPARAAVWRLAQVATSLAAAGDTAALPRLADSLRILGTRSGDARDQRIHHYVRALSLIARGQDEDALAELTRASSSPTEGYTRINLEAGRAALRRGRPRDALAAVNPALHGLIEGSGYYVTRTDLHEVAAHAWEAAGVRDSAIVHYTYLVQAWSKADPALAARVADARRRLDALKAKR